MVNHVAIEEAIECNRENCYYDGRKNIYIVIVIVEKM